MKRKLLILPFILFILMISFSLTKVDAHSYLSDKTEIPINLEVSGVEALCQTDDGYVWIGQYSGLVRYDSNEFVTYTSFEENGETNDIVNVKALKQKDNILYILTTNKIIKFVDNKFYLIKLFETTEKISFFDLALDSQNNKLYISSASGVIIYDIETQESYIYSGTENKKINDIAIDVKRNTFYYTNEDGIYNSKNELILEDGLVLDIHIYDDILLISRTTGVLRYDLVKQKISDIQYDMIDDQVNITLFSPKTNTVFIGTENKGVYCIDADTHEYSLADNLVNKAQIIDFMIDYEGNLWVASHSVSSTGVSIITKNQLLNLLFDDPIWQSLPKIPALDRNVFAMEKYGDILYIVSKRGIYSYDLKQSKIVPNTIMPVIETYATNNSITTLDFRDAEIYKDKIYFAAYGIGLVEYDPKTDGTKIYGQTELENAIVSKSDDTKLEYITMIRDLRAFDNFIALGYSKGIMKFDLEKLYIYHTGSNVLYINKGPNNEIIYDQSKGLFKINDDFTQIEGIPTIENVEGNSLKFLYDGEILYYNLNSRFFALQYINGEPVSKEIVIPYVKGSIVELSKIKLDDNHYKYVICSQNQIFITDSLEASLAEGRLINYEMYDSTNGLKEIVGNTSGYYDESSQKYYFQTSDGIFVYDFNVSKVNIIPIKIDINYVDVDGNRYYDNSITIDKNSYRIEFDLSVLGFRPSRGHRLYYKTDGIDNEYKLLPDGQTSISYTNLRGGKYTFHAYLLDEFEQKSNEIEITIIKPNHIYEEVWFWVIIAILVVSLIIASNFWIIKRRTKKAVEREKEYKAITIESIEAIARTIDAKDTYTNGHSKRVGIYSREIAKALNLSDDEVDNIYYIALLHDIGKISIPLEILNKPGRLTDEEFEIMKSHTTAGAKILDGITTIPHIVEGAKYHHERYGGGGYPTGIKGEDIPFIARIICCADCYDAMATKRVYKEPYTKEKIISEFERCKNTQFDPHIADVVIKLIKEDRLRYGTEIKKSEENK